ncbi:MAG: A/G-specific adenine glycosylase [Bacteroidia bacterium]|nr:A/G-specific adenine glycosylase [Bacteroidia bacterium]MDW8417047.1 A/G-specific adenine glycosylase [Bacteroidia bacterium]
MHESLLKKLQSWYERNGRLLPWREGEDPYRIWVIETLLQQTQIAQVEARIERFFTAFPSIESLAYASLEEVLALWQGLGYYQRAHNLHRAAQKLCAIGGFSAIRESPNPLKALMRLPGVGPYTARAILSFAGWGHFLPVDGNIMRVLSRLWAEKERNREFYQRKADALPVAWRQRWVAYALMDLAQLICVPRRPRCLLCPLASGCAALQGGNPSLYPLRLPRSKKPDRYFLVSLYADVRGVSLLRRPPRGFWGGLWSLPLRELSTKPEMPPDFTHELTHFRLFGYLERMTQPPDNTQLIPWGALPAYALPAPIFRLLVQEAEAYGVTISAN